MATDSSTLALDTLPTNCDLCPRACGANRAAGERGYCGIGAELRVARSALHEWEEPPISGGVGSGTIFFSGCSLKCVYCQNASIALGDVGQVVEPGDVAQMCLSLQEQGALNINLVTATHVAPLVRSAVTIAHSMGLTLPIVWNTSGYESVSAVQQNAGTVDVYLSDFKYADSHLAKLLSNAPDYPEVALQALDEMVKCTGTPQFDTYNGDERLVKGVVVRHLLLPGHLQDSKQVIKLVHERYGQSVLLSLMSQYTPVIARSAQAGDKRAIHALANAPELSHSTSAEEYEELLDYADSLGVLDYFWQQGDAAQESFIPAFDLTGVPVTAK